MPTTRPRHFVTETDELAAALDEAEARWPGVSRAQLIVRLALEGNGAARRGRETFLRRRKEAVQRHSGALTGAFGDGYLHDVREDWPT